MNLLLNIINYVSILASLLILSIAYRNIMCKRIKMTYKSSFYLIICALIILASNCIDNFILKSIIIVFSFYIPYQIFKERQEQFDLSYVLFAIIFANILDFIFSVIIFILPFNTTIDYFSDAVFTITIPLIILVLFSSKRFKRVIDITSKIIKTKNVYILYTLYVMVILSLLSYINIQVNDIIIKTIIFIIVLCILFLFSKLLFYKSKYDLNVTYSKQLVNCLNKYVKQNDELRKYKHNILNKILSINSLPNDQIKKYINCELLNIDINSQPYTNEVTILTSFIYEKARQKSFNSKRIIIINQIKDNNMILNNSKLFLTLSEILGISLDNAIDACKKMPKSKITIELLETKTIFKINIINDFKSNVNIDKLGKPLYTTKLTGTGIGLYTLNTNKHIKNHYKIINQKFLSMFTIQKNDFINKKASK